MEHSRKIFSKVPTLRFSGFDVEWKRKQVKNILNICHGRDYKHLGKGKFPVLGTGGVITYVNDYICNWSCVLIGRKGTINKPQFMNTPFWSVDTLFYSKSHNGQLPQFQYYLFQTINWEKYNEGSGVPSLSASTIENIQVQIPSTQEQQKIAEFLSLIDQRIEVQNKIIEDLKVLKKELCRKIFNKRLCDKEIDISQIATAIGGYAFSSKMYKENGQYKIVTIGNVTGSKYISGKYNSIDELPNNLQKQQILKKTDILISLTGNVGRLSIVNGDNFLLNQRVAKLDISDYQLKEYVYQYLSQSSFEKDMISAGQGAAQKNIKNDDILSYHIRIPSNEYILACIVKLLISYDEKIINEEKIILQLQHQRTYLLNAMFI